MLRIELMGRKKAHSNFKSMIEKVKETTHNYGIKILKVDEISKQRQDILAMKCYDVAKAANFGVTLEDVKNHLFDGNFEITLLKKESKIQGFAIFDNIEVGGRKILFLHGIVIHPESQGKGLAKRLIKENALKNNSEFLALRTHNPTMYNAATSITQNQDYIYPNFTKEIPEEIIKIAKKIKYFKNIDGEICDKNLIIKNAYPQDMLQQFLKPKNERAEIINKRFSEDFLGRFDAQGIIVKLR